MADAKSMTLDEMKLLVDIMLHLFKGQDNEGIDLMWWPFIDDELHEALLATGKVNSVEIDGKICYGLLPGAMDT